MITLKSEREIQAMEESGAILAGIHEELRGFIKPGLTTMEINNFVQARIEAAGAICEQIGFEGYEYATCTSVNDEICHGFPGKYVLKDGDLIKVDTVVNYNGAMSDSCWSYAVGEA
ncbi:MAG: M24 family metallopeptidase, partial [Trichococcus flocculiformis]